MNTLRVAIVSKADAHGGGASRVAVDLARLLNGAGHTAHHFAAWRGSPPESFSRDLYPAGLRKLFLAGHIASMLAGFPEIVPLEYPRLARQVTGYDIVHFHDISSAISPLTLAMIARRCPTVWTVHDCSPFTGGCLYPHDCRRYKNGCGSCPRLGEWPIKSFIDGTSVMRRIKGRIGREGRVAYVTPSHWMADMGRESGITANEFRVIPNGVDTELFRPRDRNRLRAELGLPVDKPLVLVSAGSILDERKGSVFAVEALRRLGDFPFALLLIGNMNEVAHRMLAGLEYHAPGYLGDSHELAKYYSCADLFLCCSLADNLPLVILETMSSGVPTVGFVTGGIPDMIEHNRCGYLVEQRDTDGLVEGLRLALVGGLAARWGEEARARAVSRFSFGRFLQNHLDFYQELLEARDGVRG